MDMAASVPGKEGNRAAIDGAGQYLVGRRSPRAVNRLPTRIVERFDAIDPRPADDSEMGLLHVVVIHNSRHDHAWPAED